MKRGVSILIILMSVAMSAQGRKTKEGKTRADIQHMRNAVTEFRMSYGMFPAESNWFASLTEWLPQSVDDADPWGNRYVYRYPGVRNSNDVDIFSMGADGKTASDGDDPDDINNWNESRPQEHYFNSRAEKWQFAVLVFLTLSFIILAATRKKNSKQK